MEPKKKKAFEKKSCHQGKTEDKRDEKEEWENTRQTAAALWAHSQENQT